MIIDTVVHKVDTDVVSDQHHDTQVEWSSNSCTVACAPWLPSQLPYGQLAPHVPQPAAARQWVLRLRGVQLQRGLGRERWVQWGVQLQRGLGHEQGLQLGGLQGRPRSQAGQQQQAWGQQRRVQPATTDAWSRFCAWNIPTPPAQTDNRPEKLVVLPAVPPR